jgi:hypothetical protein
MYQGQDNLPTILLAPDDLELLRTFLDAWCDEHAVDVTDEAAADVASALISWYKSDASDKTLLKPGPDEPLPASPRIQLLLQQLKQTRSVK